MKYPFIIFTLLFSLLLNACGATTPETTVPTEAPTEVMSPTPDLCSAANLPDEISKANKLMREFDDYSSLASNTPQNQLINLIPEMQRILRDVEDLPVPVCLQTLKQLEMAHMNLVIKILIAFMNTQGADVQSINTGIAKAREIHTKYDVEMARLLGITLVVPPTNTPGASPNATTPATVTIFVTNITATGVNLRSAPGLDAPEAGVLPASTSTAAIGKSADSQWIKVEVPGQPGQTAWVFASLVQLSVPIDQLPVTE